MSENEIVILVAALIGSQGLWTLIQYIISRHYDKKSKSHKMVLGLGHDRIIFLEKYYIKRGWISPDEYENLHDYLYLPYLDMGGNGTAEKLMEEIQELPLFPPNNEED